jgi:hypothetical protein
MWLLILMWPVWKNLMNFPNSRHICLGLWLLEARLRDMITVVMQLSALVILHRINEKFLFQLDYMCVSCKCLKNMVTCHCQVWSLEQTDWTCKIDEGSAGLVDVCWSPDSRHILTTADFHVSVWNWLSCTDFCFFIVHCLSYSNHLCPLCISD